MKYDYAELLKRARSHLPSLSGASDRFELPVAEVQTGKQTVIKNFSEIVKALRRDAKHLAKFLFKELAVPGSVRDNELYLQGKIMGSLINKRIQEYAKEFVYCNECGKADTAAYKEGRVEMIKCEACGARRSIRTI